MTFVTHRDTATAQSASKSGQRTKGSERTGWGSTRGRLSSLPVPPKDVALRNECALVQSDKHVCRIYVMPSRCLVRSFRKPSFWRAIRDARYARPPNPTESNRTERAKAHRLRHFSLLSLSVASLSGDYVTLDLLKRPKLIIQMSEGYSTRSAKDERSLQIGRKPTGQV